MSLSIKVLNLADCEGDPAFKVRSRPEGTLSVDPINVFLILGGDEPILVDAGVRNEEVLTRLGIQPTITKEHSLSARLAEHGVEIEDIGMVVMTHLHVDHAGLLDRFPMSTPVVVNRRELGSAFSGLQGLLYAPEDLHHVLDRTYTPGAMRILDLEMSGPETLAPGIRVQASGGHTDGSLMVLVDTDEGVACLCGDVLYEFEGSVLEQLNQTNLREPQTSNNFTSSMVQEKAAIKRVLNAGRFVHPPHSYWGAVVENGQIVGRVEGSIPGPVTPIEPGSGTAGAAA